MKTIKVNGLTYNWDTYKTLNFKEIHGLNFDNNEIKVLEIKSPDYDFHVVIRIDTEQRMKKLPKYPKLYWLKEILGIPLYHSVNYSYLMSMLVLGTKFSKKYDIAQTGIRLFIDRARIRKLYDQEIENKHVEKLIQFCNSERFKPYITNSSGTTILRRASEYEVCEISTKSAT